MLHMFSRLPSWTRRWVQRGLWVAAAAALALLLVTFVARSYSVHGISMEPTLRTGEAVFSTKLGRTLRSVIGKPFIPQRDQLIVFKNPFYNQGDPNMFIVKRVIGLPGERVVVRDGRITIYTPDGKSFDPDDTIEGPQGPTSGNVDRIVPEDEVFVVGDNRQGKNSLDSRNGMSTLPVRDIEGTVLFRFWPLHKFRWF